MTKKNFIYTGADIQTMPVGWYWVRVCNESKAIPIRISKDAGSTRVGLPYPDAYYVPKEGEIPEELLELVFYGPIFPPSF